RAGGKSGPARGGIRSGVESREVTIANGHRRIAQIGNQMKMSDRQIESAQRYFNLAVIENFTKGRKANSVASACLYVVCRLEKTSHMLIDFSEHLRLNVYALGATFVRLVAVLKLFDLPLVDPMLYIVRFAAKLDFEDKTADVVRDASRLVSRMDRDWIVKGRRPAGICAACLFIAARMNGFKRTAKEVVQVVKICEATLRKRLVDFRETPSSALSVEDFQTLMLEESADPPSFTHGKKRKAHDGDEEAISDSEGKRKGKGKRVDSGDEELDEEDEVENETDKQDEQEIRALLNSAEIRRVAQTEKVDMNDLDEDLSALDADTEVNGALLSEIEVKIKTKYWTEENADWILKEAAKKAAEKNGDKDRAPKKPRKKKEPTAVPTSSTAYEAGVNLISTKKTLSRKINYDLMQNLFQDDSSAGRTAYATGEYASGSVTGF
ncbi:transcription factor TFIIIB subunit brf1, partial [Chytridiales sp. JEL 0842]